jgi:hypothetical protein
VITASVYLNLVADISAVMIEKNKCLLYSTLLTLSVIVLMMYTRPTVRKVVLKWTQHSVSVVTLFHYCLTPRRGAG